MTITLNSAIGVAAVLVGLALAASVALSIRTLKVLKRSRDFLDFAFFVAARQDEEETLRSMDQEDTPQHAIIYNKGYSKGYADGEYAGMKRFMQEERRKENSNADSNT